MCSSRARRPARRASRVGSGRGAGLLLALLLSLLPASCGSDGSLAEPSDLGTAEEADAPVDSAVPEVEQQDAAVDAGVEAEDDVTAADGSGDASDVDAGDEIAADVTGDAASTCDDGPEVGCPCEEHIDKPCCLTWGKGLSCEYAPGSMPLTKVWGVFYDCGCIEGPQCPDRPVYPLCGN